MSMRKIKFTKGGVYHVFNRGVEKRDIFLSDGDRWRFLQGLYLFNDGSGSHNLLYRLEKEKGKMHFGILREYVKQKRIERKPLVRIMADCLKSNHFHLLLEEIQEEGISRFMHKLGIGYTKFFNTKHERVGSLFQGTFKAVEVTSDEQLAYLLAYINVINPGQEIEPELKLYAQSPDDVLQFAEHYPWSTNLEYLGKRDSVITEKGVAGTLFPRSENYRKFVSDVIRGKKKIDVHDDILLE